MGCIVRENLPSKCQIIRKIPRSRCKPFFLYGFLKSTFDYPKLRPVPPSRAAPGTVGDPVARMVDEFIAEGTELTPAHFTRLVNHCVAPGGPVASVFPSNSPVGVFWRHSRCIVRDDNRGGQPHNGSTMVGCCGMKTDYHHCKRLHNTPRRKISDCNTADCAD